MYSDGLERICLNVEGNSKRADGAMLDSELEL